ncbi:MAG: secretion protein HlyD [Bacteroidetes bacterium]|nr:MAG: secretion protein HlyD [Bacteroidota bacterium]
MDIKKNWVLLIPVLVIILAIIYTLSQSTSDDDYWVGMVETTYVDVASELPGRVDSLFVALGDTVYKGQRLAVLQTSKIDALVDQAKAAVDIARSQHKLIQRGNSKEVISSMKSLYELTQEQHKLAEKTWKRIDNLYRDGAISGEEKDIVYFKYQAAQKEMETAKNNYDLAKRGSEPEVKAMAKSLARQAEHTEQLAKLAAGELTLYAPRSGVISSLLISEGEVSSLGYPVLTVMDISEYKAVFQVRQDDIQQFREGSKFTAIIPGVSDESIELEVQYIAPMLDFANWIPSKDRGKFDLKTFEVHLIPLEKINELRPGMTLAIPMK